MKQSVWVLTGACALTVIIAGCSPQLDQTGLSPEEQVWAANIKANYSAWQPPESIPRSVRRDDLPAEQPAGTPGESSSQSGVMPPAEDTPATPPAVSTVPPAPVVETPAASTVPPAPAVETPADAPAVDAPAADAPAEPVIHTVVKGESLGSIAVKHYGKFSAWKKIQKANLKVLRGKNKDVVVPGMKLEIPKK